MVRTCVLHAGILCLVTILSASPGVSEDIVPVPAPALSIALSRTEKSASDGLRSGLTQDASPAGIADNGRTGGIQRDAVLQGVGEKTQPTPIPGNLHSSERVSSLKSALRLSTIPPARTTIYGNLVSLPVSTKVPRPISGSVPVSTPASVPLSSSDSIPDSVSASRVASRSYLLLLAGNATVVRLREKDFAKYLRMNLAARLSLEYDDVRVNEVLVAPSRLVVNVSLVGPVSALAPSPSLVSSAALSRSPGLALGRRLLGDSPLHMMADTNATLLELSGEEYRIVRLVALSSEYDQHELQRDVQKQQLQQGKEQATELDTEQETEQVTEPVMEEEKVTVTVNESPPDEDESYVLSALLGTVGILLLLGITIVFGLTFKVATKWERYYRTLAPPKITLYECRRRLNAGLEPEPEPEDNLLPTYLAPPAMIYSAPFADHAGNGRLHWLQVDDSSTRLLGPSDVSKPKYSQLHNQMHSQVHSPSKLHIFSCRPGTVVIPLRYNHSQQSIRGTSFPLG